MNKIRNIIAAGSLLLPCACATVVAGVVGGIARHYLNLAMYEPAQAGLIAKAGIRQPEARVVERATLRKLELLTEDGIPYQTINDRYPFGEVNSYEDNISGDIHYIMGNSKICTHRLNGSVSCSSNREAVKGLNVMLDDAREVMLPVESDNPEIKTYIIQYL